MLRQPKQLAKPIDDFIGLESTAQEQQPRDQIGGADIVLAQLTELGQSSLGFLQLALVEERVDGAQLGMVQRARVGHESIRTIVLYTERRGRLPRGEARFSR